MEGWKTTTLGECLALLTDYTANGSFESLKQNVTYFDNHEYAVLVRTSDLAKSPFAPERFTDHHGYHFLEILSNVG
ncbi:MAG TPA: restriction endonuclease subunit S, partial [Deltaproteobacteria bacterium]|nr:restriction endonuclease subunit S [Deltaproteobacteria bacterium]